MLITYHIDMKSFQTINFKYIASVFVGSEICIWIGISIKENKCIDISLDDKYIVMKNRENKF